MAITIHPTWLEVLADPIRLNVLLVLSTTGSGTAADIAGFCHASQRTVKRHLHALVALGLAREVGPESDGERRGRPPTRFILDNAVRERAEAMFTLLNQPLAPSR
jgi:predicted ArsR family transcriptional regulator